MLTFFQSKKQLNALKVRHDEIETTYAPVSLEEEKLSAIEKQYKALQKNYQEKLSELKKGERRLTQYHLGVGTTDTSTYKPLMKDKSLQQIEAELEEIKFSHKFMVSNKEACVCNMGNDVEVNGKKSEAKKLFNREIKLRLRCLDNEFKAANAIVDWNNINRLIQRTRDTFKEINASGGLVKTYISDKYLNLKIKELRLNYEFNKLKQETIEAEHEELRIQREAEREEKRIKAAAEKAEKERMLMEKLVAEELAKLESSSEEQKSLYEFHKQELKKLREKEQRAISLAQQTRAGYVYIICNKTSFGDGVVKIGMTRRVDPQDRVNELGDASVPEVFDVHAFIFTENAPALENYLHNQFEEKRVNLVNRRREFFHVSHDEVIVELANYDGNYELTEFEAEPRSEEP